MERSPQEDVAVEHVVERLTARFPTVPVGVVHDIVTDLHESFDNASVRDFVPVIIEHDAKDRLRQAD